MMSNENKEKLPSVLEERRCRVAGQWRWRRLMDLRSIFKVEKSRSYWVRFEG